MVYPLTQALAAINQFLSRSFVLAPFYNPLAKDQPSPLQLQQDIDRNREIQLRIIEYVAGRELEICDTNADGNCNVEALWVLQKVCLWSVITPVFLLCLFRNGTDAYPPSNRVQSSLAY